MQIDRLSLEIPGVSESQRAASLDCCSPTSSPRQEVPAIGDMPRLRIDLIADPLSNPDQLIDRIVAEVMAQLRRVP